MTIEEMGEAVRYAFDEWQQAGPRHEGKIDEVRDAVLAALDELERWRERAIRHAERNRTWHVAHPDANREYVRRYRERQKAKA